MQMTKDVLRGYPLGPTVPNMGPRKEDVGRARSGTHKNPRRLLTQTQEDFDMQEKAAAADPECRSWGEWIKKVANRAAKRQLAKK